MSFFLVHPLLLISIWNYGLSKCSVWKVYNIYIARAIWFLKEKIEGAACHFRKGGQWCNRNIPTNVDLMIILFEYISVIVPHWRTYIFIQQRQSCHIKSPAKGPLDSLLLGIFCCLATGPQWVCKPPPPTELLNFFIWWTLTRKEPFRTVKCEDLCFSSSLLTSMNVWLWHWRTAKAKTWENVKTRQWN